MGPTRRLFITVVLLSVASVPPASAANMSLDPATDASTLAYTQGVQYARQGIDYKTAVWATPEQGMGGTSHLRYRETLCFSTSDPQCAARKVGNEYRGAIANIYLSPCVSDADVGCIEDVAVSADGQTPVAAAFVSALATDNPEIVENAKMRIPRGSSVGLWRTPSGGNYLVRAMLQGTIKSVDKSAPRFDFRDIRMRVSPVAVTDLPAGVEPTGTARAFTRYDILPGGAKVFGGNLGSCTPTQCTTPVDFAPGTRIRMSVRIPEPNDTWMTGRIDNAVVTTVKLPGGRARLTVEGDALATQHAGGAAATAGIPADLLQKWWCTPTCRQDMPRSEMDAFRSFLDLEPYLGARSVLTRTRWEVSSTWDAVSSNTTTAECLGADTGLVGIVGTNAAVYEAKPPAWNAETGRLDFRIASPHLDADGNVTIGRYTLAVPPSVAQCLYGRSALPPTVEVTVTEDNGTTRTETVAVSNDGNWVRFAVSGFTFSAPRITVKLGVGTTIRPGRSLGAAAIRSAAGLPAGAKVSLSIAKSSAKICRMRGGAVSALKKGMCVVKVRSGATTRTLSVSVRGS